MKIIPEMFLKNGKCHNILATSKRTKEQTPIYKTLHIKLNNEKHEPTHKTRVNSIAAKGKQFLLH